jgi:hypothetical protein
MKKGEKKNEAPETFEEDLSDLVNLGVAPMGAFLELLSEACESEEAMMNSRDQISILATYIKRQVDANLNRLFDFIEKQGVQVIVSSTTGQNNENFFQSVIVNRIN